MPPRRFTRPAHAFAALVGSMFLFFTAAAQAAAPAAPTNLRGGFNSTTSITITWDDLTGDQTGFEVDYVDTGGQHVLGTFAATGASNNFSLTNLTVTAGVNYTFKVRAYNGATTNASAFISIPMTPGALVKPTTPLLATQPDGSLRIMWTDNSTAETGYSIELSTTASTGPYTVLGTVAANISTVSSGTLNPSTTYFWKVRPFQGTTFGPYSDVFSATTGSTLNAPTGLTVTTISPNETSVNFAFADNTALNNNYAIEYCLHGSGTFVTFGQAADNNSINATNSVAPGTAYDFRLRAYYDNGTHTNLIFSPYSNTATVTTPFNAPTSLVATAASDSQVNLTWTDNSQAEGGYSIYYRPSGGGSFTLYNFAATNATSYSVTGLSPGTAYDFQVAAAFQRTTPGTSTLVESTPSNTSSVTTKDGFTSPPFLPVTYGQNFSYQATTSTVSSRTSWSATGLPMGLNFDTNSGAITGSPTQSGLFTANLSATFSNGWTAHWTVNLRVINPPTAPVVATPLASSQTFSTGDAAANIPLTNSFSDPDVESAVRLVTTKGNIDVLLYNAETPATVTNFLGYVNRGDYANSAFHRISSIATSGVAVLQGGEFKPTTAGADTFASIPLQASVQNEPGISNLNYTIAMAKSGGDPNSATSQFYFNLTDLDNSLDQASQNGGFTVFGRVSGATKANLDAITSSPEGGPYNITADGSTINQGFLWPMNVPDQASVPATMDNTKIMKIISATPLTQTLTYSASSSSSSVATASVTGTNLTITPVAAGAAVITVTATDLDGMTATQTINVTVNQTLAQWASSQGLSGLQGSPTADPDQDGLNNLEEFALMTNPTVPNTPGATSYALANAGAVNYGQITFPVRKFAPSLTYTVEVSDTLAAGSWTALWTTTDGFNAAVVTSAVDQTDRTILTVQDTQPSPPATHRFLRVKISSP